MRNWDLWQVEYEEQEEIEKVLCGCLCLQLAQLSPQALDWVRVMEYVAELGLGDMLPLNLCHLDHPMAPGSV